MKVKTTAKALQRIIRRLWIHKGRQVVEVIDGPEEFRNMDEPDDGRKTTLRFERDGDEPYIIDNGGENG